MSRTFAPHTAPPKPAAPATPGSFASVRHEERAEHEAERAARIVTRPTSAPPPPLSPDPAHRRNPSPRLPATPGRPLPNRLSATFAPRFDADFSRVRLHTDGPAARAASALHADAFTHGRDVYFASGRYRPGTSSGDRLLAHELAHVVQQQNVPAEHYPLRRRLQDGAPGSERRSSMPDPAIVESAAGGVMARLRSGGTAAVLRSLLERLDPLTREAVVRRVQPLLTPEEQDVLAEAVETIGVDGPATQRAAGEPAPGARRTRAGGPGEGEEPSPEGRHARRDPARAATQPAATGSGAPEAAQAASELPEATPEAVATRVDALFDELAARQTETEAGEVETEGAADEAVEEEGPEAPAAEMEGEEEAKIPSLRDLVLPPEETELTEEEEEDYEVETARAEAAVIADEVETAEQEAVGRVRRAAGRASAGVNQRAEAARQAVISQAESARATMTAAFDAQQSAVDGAIRTAGETIDSDHRTRREAVTGRAESARTMVRNEFRNHRPATRQVVTDVIQAASDYQVSARSSAAERNQSYADRARRSGDTYARNFSHSRRGNVQRRAARQAAEATAREIESREADVVEAVDELTENVPSEVRDQGQQALDQIDDSGLPGLIDSIDRQEQAVLQALDGQHQRATESLQQLQQELTRELTGLRQTASGRLTETSDRALQEMDGALPAALGQISGGEARALRPMRQQARETAALIREADTPDPEAARATADEIITFLDGGAEEAETTLTSTGSQMAKGFTKAEEASAAGLTALEQTTADSLGRLDADLTTRLQRLTDGTRDGLEGSKTGFDEAAEDVEDRVHDQMQEGRDQLDTDLRANIVDLQPEVNEAVREGMTKNQEALRDLPGAMREAAADAAWDFDHPILSRIRDVAALVAGVIVGILLVVALVVAVIVAFKLLIAGLVVLGISLAVAKLVALAVGLGLLAWGIYSAYSARVEAGLDAGPWAIVQDLTGISQIRQSFDNPDLTPFQRGRAFGEGAATLVAFVFLRGRRAGKLDRSISARLPRGVTNPQRGAGLRSLRPERFQRPGGLETRGYRPQAGERATTRAEYRAQERARRLQQRAEEGRPVPEPPPRRAPEPARPPERPAAPASERPGRPRAPERPAAPPAAERPAAGGPPAPPRERGGEVIPFPGRRPAGPPRGGLESRGYRPRAGERSTTREAYREQSRIERAQRTGGRPDERNVRSIFRDRSGRPRQGPEPPPRTPQEGRQPIPQEQPLQATGTGGPVRGHQLPSVPGTPPRRPQIVASSEGTGGRSGTGAPAQPTPSRPTTPSRPAGPSAPSRQGGTSQPAGPRPAAGRQDPATTRPRDPFDAGALRQQRQRLAQRQSQVERAIEQAEQRRRGLNDEAIRVEQARQRALQQMERSRQGSPEHRAALEEARAARARQRQLVEEQHNLIEDQRALRTEHQRNAAEIHNIDIRTDPSHRAALPCFAPGTPVLTPAGPCPIESLSRGDLVIAYDFERGRPISRAVLAVHPNHTRHFYRIRCGGVVIDATGRHPFWVASDGRWTRARDLRPGMLLMRTDGSTCPVDEVELSEDLDSPTYNLTVDTSATYYVGAGVLVHNVDVVNVGLGGNFVVYEAVNPLFPDEVYIGQTDNVATRQTQHRGDASRALRQGGLSPREQRFYEFMKGAELRPRVTGLQNVDQASFVEQRNIEIERQIRGEANVRNRREQLRTSYEDVAQRIRSDPAVQKAGLCPP